MSNTWKIISTWLLKIVALWVTCALGFSLTDIYYNSEFSCTLLSCIFISIVWTFGMALFNWYCPIVLLVAYFIIVVSRQSLVNKKIEMFIASALIVWACPMLSLFIKGIGDFQYEILHIFRREHALIKLLLAIIFSFIWLMPILLGKQSYKLETPN